MLYRKKRGTWTKKKNQNSPSFFLLTIDNWSSLKRFNWIISSFKDVFVCIKSGIEMASSLSSLLLFCCCRCNSCSSWHSSCNSWNSFFVLFNVVVTVWTIFSLSTTIVKVKVKKKTTENTRCSLEKEIIDNKTEE